ncbi:aa3-type cytochrome c oxidase subunit IV [Acuticoccus kandeliae]|uniref:aa3-type cytochrome c oxidase subunit IV n=1 Tax=Acuticoccus kandeliae TaxID=2073160 RepID=UPI00196A1E85|nr:aa3-type cytochrome c oxidase subunit IV [Acuticoccus kandeliae]
MSAAVQHTHDIDPNASGEIPQIDFAEHERTYEAFLNGAKWTIILVAILLFGMLFFLV